MAFSSSEIRTWTVYKITNPIGQVYVGRTTNFIRRIKRYKYLECTTQPLIYNSITKFGFKNHIIDIIESFESNRDYADGKEMFWIRSQMSNIHKWPEINGLNDCEGGTGTLGKKFTKEQREKLSKYKTGHKHTERTKRKIGDAARGNKFSLGSKHTEAWKKDMSERQKGNKHNLGRTQSLATIEKRVQHLRGKKDSDEVRKRKSLAMILARGRPIYQYDINGNLLKEYNSIQEAVRYLNWHQSLIVKVLRGERSHTNKWIFKYK